MEDSRCRPPCEAVHFPDPSNYYGEAEQHPRKSDIYAVVKPLLPSVRLFKINRTCPDRGC